MMARSRARIVSLLVALPIFAALATGCLLWYAASDPLGDTGQAIQCKASQKVCVGACVEQNEPAVGCSGPCSACNSNPNAQSVCTLEGDEWVCAQGACNSEFADCDHDASDGCETDTTDNPNCGSCGVDCPVFCAPTGTGYGCSTTCDASLCGSKCDPDSGADCKCVDLETNNNNCGSCGHKCTVTNGNGYCDAGNCSITCNPGYCPDGTGKCTTDLGASPNCGACGVTCTGVTKCCPRNGSYACVPSFTAPSDGATGGGGVCNP